MVVKKIISRLESKAFILLAMAKVLVKWPKPTPFVGNITIQFPLVKALPARFDLKPLGCDFNPIHSSPIMNIMNGKEMIKNGALHGLRIAVVM